MKSAMAFRGGSNNGSKARWRWCAIVAVSSAIGCGGSPYKPAPLQPAVCSGIDLHPASNALDEQSLVTFLKAQGLATRVERARGDLVYVHVQNPQIRFRVAILNSPMVAGKELHEAILQHKDKGGWGLRRSNLAVLVEAGDKLDKTVDFATRSKLACWGVLTVAASDEAVVIPGGYREL